MSFKNIQLKVKVEVTFLTQHLDLSVFDPNPALIRVWLNMSFWWLKMSSKGENYSLREDF